jgi:capsular polysaccharide transport system permease protein
MAQRICAALVAEGERFMNQMGHSLALEQVTFLEKQAESMGARVAKTRQALLDYQNVKRLASPKASIEGAGAIIARLEGEISQLSARREAMLGYLSPTSSDVAQIDLQISALKKQLSLTQQRMTSVQGEALNRINEEYQRLEMEAAFAQEVYQQALTALEKGRIESVRTLKKISVVQSPTLPQQSLEPQRLYNTVIFTLATLMLAGIVHLLAAIIRDHKD